jgi:hypothetical protein
VQRDVGIFRAPGIAPEGVGAVISTSSAPTRWAL